MFRRLQILIIKSETIVFSTPPSSEIDFFAQNYLKSSLKLAKIFCCISSVYLIFVFQIINVLRLSKNQKAYFATTLSTKIELFCLKSTVTYFENSQNLFWNLIVLYNVSFTNNKYLSGVEKWKSIFFNNTELKNWLFFAQNHLKFIFEFWNGKKLFLIPFFCQILARQIRKVFILLKNKNASL